MKQKMIDLANGALDSMDNVREKIKSILDLAENEEGCEDIVATITNASSQFVKTNSILEDILGYTEDLEEV